MKTSPLPSRPANVPAPPSGYVFLGHRRDINAPATWDAKVTPDEDKLSFAACCEGGCWCEWTDMRAHKYFSGYLAAKPNTRLYNLNKDRLPMNKPAATVKTLKYEVVTRQSDLVAAKITEQSHRGAEFGEGSDNFGNLESCNSPENAIGTYQAKFFVLGNRPTQDNDLMLFTADQFAQFEKEVAAYNAHFSKPKILRTVFFKYNGGSIRGYRRVEVIKEDSTHIEGLDSDNGEYRKYLKSKIVGPVDTVKA